MRQLKNTFNIYIYDFAYMNILGNESFQAFTAYLVHFDLIRLVCYKHWKTSEWFLKVFSNDLAALCRQNLFVLLVSILANQNDRQLICHQRVPEKCQIKCMVTNAKAMQQTDIKNTENTEYGNKRPGKLIQGYWTYYRTQLGLFHQKFLSNTIRSFPSKIQGNDHNLSTYPTTKLVSSWFQRLPSTFNPLPLDVRLAFELIQSFSKSLLLIFKKQGFLTF